MTVHAVFIGSSNSTPGTWPETLSTRQGWTPHIYSVGGGGFTSALPGRFDTQINAAVADTSYDHAEVEYVFVGDMGNDVRATYSIAANAPAVFDTARAAFPNARVIVVPVMWGWATLNRIPGALVSLTQRMQELREAALPRGVEIVEWSWTWHADDPAWMKPNEVHYTAAGYLRVVQFVEKYLRGEPTDSPRGWAFIEGINSQVVDWRYAWLRGRRDGNNVQAHGPLTLLVDAPIDTHLGWMPKGLTPLDVTRLIVVSNGGARGTGTVDLFPNGQVRSFGALAAGTWNFNSTYPAF